MRRYLMHRLMRLLHVEGHIGVSTILLSEWRDSWKWHRRHALPLRRGLLLLHVRWYSIIAGRLLIEWREAFIRWAKDIGRW